MFGLVRSLLVAALVIAADRASKLWVVEGLNLREIGTIEVAPPYLVFRMAWNRGINFGILDMGDGAGRWVLIGIALAISAALSVWAWRAERRWVPVCLGLVIGGALGNAWDRVAYGAVADFLNVSCCGIANPFSFNVADTAIFVGAVALVLIGEEHRT